MNKQPRTNHEQGEGTIRSYTTGFIASLVLTLGAYLIVTKDVSHGWALVLVLSVLAVIQLVVQLIFFLHLGKESKPRWNLSMLIFAVGVVFIVVFGSIWIMKNLEYGHHHQPSQTEIIKDEGYGQ